MRKALIPLAIIAAISITGCAAWDVTRQHLRYRQFIEEWGIHKPDPYNPSKKL
jgi:hypothetical protein